MAVCAAPLTAAEAHAIPEGARILRVQLELDWGAADLRDTWKGDYTFCSFECLAHWASERAADHDQHVLVEGEKPEGDEPADAG